jgi:hypothetical protein
MPLSLEGLALSARLGAASCGEVNRPGMDCLLGIDTSSGQRVGDFERQPPQLPRTTASRARTIRWPDLGPGSESYVRDRR